jgi:hypothetical protein
VLEQKYYFTTYISVLTDFSDLNVKTVLIFKYYISEKLVYTNKNVLCIKTDISLK